jgi:hypothetical protein
MGLENLVDKLGKSTGKSESMKEAVIGLRENELMSALVDAIEEKTKTQEGKAELELIFKRIRTIKNGIVANAFSGEDTNCEDAQAMSEWPSLTVFIDTLVEGLSA